MKHCMKLNDNPFAAIEKGEKTIELRLYDEKRKKINVGDEIEFSCAGVDYKLIADVKSCTVSMISKNFTALFLLTNADIMAEKKKRIIRICMSIILMRI